MPITDEPLRSILKEGSLMPLVFDDGSEAWPGWWATINGEAPDVLHWHRLFGATLSPAVRKQEHGVFYISDPQFMSAANAGVARTDANSRVAELNLDMAVNYAALPIIVASVLEVIDEHHIVQHHSSVLQIGAPALPPSAPAIEPLRLKNMSWREKVAALLASLDATSDWPGVYRAIEWIERVAGGEARLARTLEDSSAAHKNMKWTANYHRHAVGTRPPKLTVWADTPRLLRASARAALARPPTDQPRGLR